MHLMLDVKKRLATPLSAKSETFANSSVFVALFDMEMETHLHKHTQSHKKFGKKMNVRKIRNRNT